MYKLLVIEENVLRGMASNAKYLREFPCLVAVQQAIPAGGCGGCGSRRTAEARVSFEAARTCIGTLPDSKKIQLRQMLHAHRVRIRFRTANGKLQELTF